MNGVSALRLAVLSSTASQCRSRVMRAVYLNYRKRGNPRWYARWRAIRTVWIMDRMEIDPRCYLKARAARL
jgi:hypothetical protein